MRILPLLVCLCLSATTALASDANLHSDFNGDGMADLLWRNSSSGKNLIWLSGKSAKKLPVAVQENLNWYVIDAIAEDRVFDAKDLNNILALIECQIQFHQSRIKIYWANKPA